ncbi:hypothetical protein GCM10010295_47320 [Streptomyces intermedius]
MQGWACAPGRTPTWRRFSGGGLKNLQNSYESAYARTREFRVHSSTVVPGTRWSGRWSATPVGPPALPWKFGGIRRGKGGAREGASATG